MWEENFLKSTTRQHGAVLEYFVASCDIDKRSSEMLRKVRLWEVEILSWSIKDRSQFEEERRARKKGKCEDCSYLLVSR